jgi:hypothetical protein
MNISFENDGHVCYWGFFSFLSLFFLAMFAIFFSDAQKNNGSRTYSFFYVTTTIDELFHCYSTGKYQIMSM